MLNHVDALQYLSSSNLEKKREEGDFAEAPAALPDASLDFLVETCKVLGIQNVFEFGSGRSTKALLSAECSVTSLEDSEYWMVQTQQTLSVDESSRHTRIVKPFKTRFLGLFPVLDWELDEQIIREIQKADLILVDSPHYTPFRESTLWSVLTVSRGAIIILDDARIPTLKRFSNRLAKSNPSLTHVRVHVGHVFDVFYKGSNSSLQLNHSLVDILKGWNRYFQGRRFYKQLG